MAGAFAVHRRKGHHGTRKAPAARILARGGRKQPAATTSARSSRSKHAPKPAGTRYGEDPSGEGKQEFGMSAIFDNVRDGLILLRYPEEVVVLFNRAASDTCGMAAADVLGRRLYDIIPDAKVAETARRCSEQDVGEWPGHDQDVLPTKIDGKDGSTRDVELHFCRVDDPQTGKPLVLLVMRPDDEAELEVLAAIAKRARHHVSELDVRLRKRRDQAASNTSSPGARPARVPSHRPRPSPKRVRHPRGAT